MKKPIPVAFESKGVNIHAIFYQASGVEPLPTVILCHGFAGNDTDVLGLGERLMKDGYNALAFNYRGTWGSEGLFTIANSLEDVTSAIHYVESSSTIREFNVDPSRISARPRGCTLARATRWLVGVKSCPTNISRLDFLPQVIKIG
jgi:dienelactone hydrolase